MKQNSKCRLYSDCEEKINHIISECNKLAQKKYKVDMTGLGRESTRNCAINLNLTILSNDICPNQNPFLRQKKLSGILKYKQIP